MLTLSRNKSYPHPFHLVDVSPWPILVSLATLCLILGLISTSIPNYMLTFTSISLLLVVVSIWWREVIRESTGGFHTTQVHRGLMVGFLLFLLSEIMLFVSFFWAFFHSSLSPVVELDVYWPPIGIHAVNPWAIPLLGSSVLLASGFVLTLALPLTSAIRGTALLSLLIVILLGLLFIFMQFNEYCYGEFTMADSVLGSVFYMTTGLHAIHVIIGVLFLVTGLFRLSIDSFTTEHHLGLELAIFYWHLVDLVWLMVFIIFYWFSSFK